jgi:hypothetical protein
VTLMSEMTSRVENRSEEHLDSVSEMRRCCKPYGFVAKDKNHTVYGFVTIQHYGFVTMVSSQENKAGGLSGCSNAWDGEREKSLQT